MYDQLKLENQLCFRLYTASRLVTQAYRPYFEPLGITYPQYLVLLILWEQDNLPVSDITSRLMLDTNTVTPLLQRMEREGLITRTRGTVDSRQRIVSLTPRGLAMQEQAKDIPSCISRKWDGKAPSVEEIFAMAKTLDSMIETLKQ
ncbi:MAG: MarR family transcriptional regulator [Bacteroidales bacterium]|nr:MarR family transcriptional regulator [Bacteroidales bacterium]